MWKKVFQTIRESAYTPSLPPSLTGNAHVETMQFKGASISLNWILTLILESDKMRHTFSSLTGVPNDHHNRA